VHTGLALAHIWSVPTELALAGMTAITRSLTLNAIDPPSSAVRAALEKREEEATLKIQRRWEARTARTG
jgi:hypothetical protein